MEKDSSITFLLPTDIFCTSRKSSVLREDIINLCNMNEVKTFTLVAYDVLVFICSWFERKCACPLQVGSTECEYYVMKFMREIVNGGSIVISDSNFELSIWRGD
ncbi:hypothetical protein IC582_020095 [Cucumis melo]